ncbi:hypothetical protein [Laspinema olomoucense]|uniref:Nif11 domain-containing protein n=1 Tax=Laspinema olomoucense D3b TaxID=2953688 RepID=A0ABT2NEM7_9CYAN|nr:MULTISPECIES: hypothetical protein [unclassified Laspinema]MCT7972570.1 hypothetical protein [Laspinema sp. D3d]MCT7981160.1 hypothetical protein [Laspinema sp. D3b]
MTPPKNSSEESSPKSSKLFDLLSDLAKNPGKAQKFNENRSQILDDYEIEEELKTLLMTGEWADFQEAVQKEAEEYGLKAP